MYVYVCFYFVLVLAVFGSGEWTKWFLVYVKRGVLGDCVCLIECFFYIHVVCFTDLYKTRRSVTYLISKTMLAHKQAEEAIVSNETEHEANREDIKEAEDTSVLNIKSFLWHGGSAWDAWFSCASNQVCKIKT